MLDHFQDLHCKYQEYFLHLGMSMKQELIKNLYEHCLAYVYSNLLNVCGVNMIISIILFAFVNRLSIV